MKITIELDNAEDAQLALSAPQLKQTLNNVKEQINIFIHKIEIGEDFLPSESTIDILCDLLALVDIH